MKKKVPYFVLCLLLFLPQYLFASERREPEIIRIAGIDRYETAVKVSEIAFDRADTAVIASGETWPDALCGGVLGSWVDGPLLLIKRDSIPAAVHAELERLGVRRILLLGDENTLSKNVENSLSRDYEAQRIAGANRVDTSQQIGKWIEKEYLDRITLGGGNPFYVSSKNFADALSAPPLVNNYYNYPGILYLLDEPVMYATASVKIGGSRNGISNHIAGSDRYETSALLYGQGNRSLESILLVSGENFPDGLASGPMSTKFHSSILLTQKDSIPTVIKERLRTLSGKTIYIIGGEKTISNNVIDELKEIYK